MYCLIRLYFFTLRFFMDFLKLCLLEHIPEFGNCPKLNSEFSSNLFFILLFFRSVKVMFSQNARFRTSYNRIYYISGITTQTENSWHKTNADRKQ